LRVAAFIKKWLKDDHADQLLTIVLALKTAVVDQLHSRLRNTILSGEACCAPSGIWQAARL
jgi:hypothetical protein